MQITKKQAMELWKGLTSMAGAEHRVKLSYAIARNRETMRKVVEAIQEATKPIQEYEDARIALVQECCARKPDGEPIILPDGQNIIPDMASFTKKLTEIKKKTGQDKKEEEVEALLEETEEIQIHQVDFEILPETIRPDVLGQIMLMVREPKDETEGDPTPKTD